MNKVNITQNASNYIETIMPLPLESLEQAIKKGNYDEKIDRAYMKLLQSNLVKKLNPIIDNVLEEEQYEGSPIYNGYIDRDTISTIVDKVIYYAQEQYPEIKEVFEEIDTNEYSKLMLLRSIIHELVLAKIYYVIRPDNKDNINYNNDDIITPNTEIEDISPDNIETMPLPIGA